MYKYCGMTHMYIKNLIDKSHIHVFTNNKIDNKNEHFVTNRYEPKVDADQIQNTQVIVLNVKTIL